MSDPLTPPPPDGDSSIAHQLAGRDLADGWRILERIDRGQDDTGGYRSVGYHVEHIDGRRGFLKALDFTDASSLTGDVTRRVGDALAHFRFEVDLLNQCLARRMSRVVVAITSGEIRVEGAPFLGVIPYIIFDRASGDVRAQLASRAFDEARVLRTLHHVATGLQQLHGAQVAHNDLKPSNVLTFGAQGAKLADLGNAVDNLGVSPHNDADYPGDKTYAPPEALYGHVGDNRWRHRLLTDMYQLGGLTVFLITHRHFNTVLSAHLAPELRPPFWGGSIAGDYAQVQPHVVDAFDRAMTDVQAALLENTVTSVGPQLVALVRQLCHPDPARRGHPKTLGRSTVGSLERYVSAFNALVLRAELDLKRRVAG